MKTKPLSILFALVMVLSMAVGVFAEDFSETWDENTVLTVFNDLDMYFPDMFADEDSDFLWVESGPADYPSEFAKSGSEYAAKAPIVDPATKAEFTYDPCGDGLIKYDITVTKDVEDGTWVTGGGYYGDSNTTYVRDIDATLTVGSTSYSLGIKTCESTGGDNCKAVSFKKTKSGDYEAHLKGYMTVPYGIILSKSDKVDMNVFFSTYMTALWKVETSNVDYAYITAEGNLEESKKSYCQPSLETYNAFSYSDDPDFEFYATRAKYDENTGEARLQVVVRNFQPGDEDQKRQNYVIPAEVFAFWGEEPSAAPTQRITDYVCKATVFNVANAAPRTDYCKFGEGIAIPNHGMVRIDISIDHLSGAMLRAASGENIPFYLRLGGLTGESNPYGPIYGEFEAVEIPCPPVSRLQVKDPIKPFMTFFNVLKNDGAISPSGAYGVYEGGVWGMYQKCGKLAYMAVRLNNDGIQDEVIDLNKTAVALNGGTPMKWNWAMSTVEPEKNNKIILPAGEEVILIGRAKVTDIPSQLNADVAMTGAVNFTDLGFYITGKVFSDHNNTRCVAAPK